jgi:hypothetical protein
MKIVIVLLVCGLLNCGCVTSETDNIPATEQDKSISDHLSGEWVFTILTYGVRDLDVDLKTKAVFIKNDDGSYSGTYETLPPEYPKEWNITTNTELPKYELENINLDGNKMSFEYYGYKNIITKFSGILEGDTVTGTQKTIDEDTGFTLPDRTITGIKIK